MPVINRQGPLDVSSPALSATELIAAPMSLKGTPGPHTAIAAARLSRVTHTRSCAAALTAPVGCVDSRWVQQYGWIAHGWIQLNCA